MEIHTEIVKIGMKIDGDMHRDRWRYMTIRTEIDGNSDTYRDGGQICIEMMEIVICKEMVGRYT
jgi:hypothetical protein